MAFFNALRPILGLNDHACAVMYVQGDHYYGGSNSASDYNYTVDEASGFGRIRAHYPGDSNIAEWFNDVLLLGQGGVVDRAVNYGNPLPTSIEGFKVAVKWEGRDADIKVEVVDKCPPGGGEDVIRTAWYKQHRRKTIQLKSDANLHGRCLYVRYSAPYVVSGHLEKVWGSRYLYEDSEVRH